MSQSQWDVEKAMQAVEYLSSLDLPTSSSATPLRRPLLKDHNGKGKARMQSNYSNRTGDDQLMTAANQALNTLKRLQTTTGHPSGGKRKKEAVALGKVVWRHKFVCLSDKAQETSILSIEEKARALRGGLGEKEVEFKSLNLSRDQFKELLYSIFPLLKNGGGFQFLRCAPNSRKLELLPSHLQNSPFLLKQFVGGAKTFIRPLQLNLELPDVEEVDSEPLEECLFCSGIFPVNVLKDHCNECREQVSEVEMEEIVETVELHVGESSYEANPSVQGVDDDGSRRGVDSSDDDDPPLPPSLFPNQTGSLTRKQSSSSDSDDDLPPLPSFMCTKRCNNDQQGSSGSGDLFHHTSSSSSTTVSLASILMKLKSNLKPGTVRIEVRRDNLIEDSLKEAKKKKFNPMQQLKVCFALELAIDQGGPRREFFRHLAKEVAMKYFIGDEGKFFLTNAVAIENKDLFILGQYCGMSIIQAGMGFPFFHATVYNYFVSGTCVSHNVLSLPLEDIPYGILREIVGNLSRATSDEEVRSAFQTDEALEFLCSTGYSKPISTLSCDDGDVLRSMTLNYHCFLKVKAEMDQFLDGLSTTGVLNCVRNSPELLKSMFVFWEKKLSADDLKNLVTFSDTIDHSLQRSKETWIYFCDFLDMCEDGSVDCQVSDVLAFISGASTVPPLGFEKNLKVEFISGMLPTASTCDLKLRLPTSHLHQQSFVDSFRHAIKGGSGFGHL